LPRMLRVFMTWMSNRCPKWRPRQSRRRRSPQKSAHRRT
jgi:hypothetical protein